MTVPNSNTNQGPSSKKNKPQATEKTVIKALSLGGGAGGGVPCCVDVKDGKVVRIRPLHYDWKYDEKDFNPWQIKARGKVFEPKCKSVPSPFSLAYKKRVYSPNRVKYPLKRVDWDPNGERNPQNRGISKYKRVSWDEAAGLIGSELKRIQKQYGTYAVLVQGDGHSQCWSVHPPHGTPSLLIEKLGGFTQQVRNPDSWEGWYWGSKHVWGHGRVGMMNPTENTVKDVSEHSEMLLFWGGDPETTPWGFHGQGATRLCYFWSEIGIKQVYICPDLNYGAAVHADKWIPVLPNTDAALQLAVIYQWVTNGTYDKEYVKTHVVGMDKIEDYVLGKEDGVPKTPAWASPKCGVPEWTIKALADEFAKKVTTIAHYFGGSYIRGPYSHEPARLECILLGMQGLGKPGVHQIQVGYHGTPLSTAQDWSTKMSADAHGKNWVAGTTSGAIADVELDKHGRMRAPRLLLMHNYSAQIYSKQHIPKTLIQEAINNAPISWYGTGAIEKDTVDQFTKYTYPIAKEEGGTEIHMIWMDNPCRTTCWNAGFDTIEAYRNPKIEIIVAQHPWLENDCMLADIILPGDTPLEEDDLVVNRRKSATEYMSAALQRRAIEPIGESRSDYRIVLEVAERMGLYDKVSEGKSIDDWIKEVYDNYSDLPSKISWEEFQEKEYYVFPTRDDWEDIPAGMYEFYMDPEANPLPTPSGKLEFYSERLAKEFPDDKERPPIPKWIEKGETHDERTSSERAKMLPLLLMSNHGRWRMHAQCDDISWTREAPTCKVKAADGYWYEPVWINTKEAEKRGVKTGDIVKVFNERGIVLCGAYVTERLMAGAAYVDHGSRCDWIVPGKIDRGGAINLIAPKGITSKNCGGQATSGYLVQVEKVSMEQMEEWKQQYPDAFKREYDPGSGLRFNAWVVE